LFLGNRTEAKTIAKTRVLASRIDVGTTGRTAIIGCIRQGGFGRFESRTLYGFKTGVVLNANGNEYPRMKRIIVFRVLRVFRGSQNVE
jgi:hypothetical protein